MRVEDLLNNLVREEAGGVGYRVSVKNIPPEIGNISGTNALLQNEIEIYISPKLELDDESKRYFEKKGIKATIFSIAKDIARHEIGHWEYPRDSNRGCPFDWFLAEEIVTGTKRGLGNKKIYADYVANSFMDIVDNLNVAYSLREKNKNFAGQVWFYYDQGRVGGKYTPFYDFFVKTQEFLWMDNDDKNFLKQFHLNSEEVDECVDEFFRELNLNKGLNLSSNLSLLLQKDEWEYQAEIYARIAGKLLGKAIPVEILTGGEKIGKESRFEKKLKDPHFLGKVIRRRWERGKDYRTPVENEDYALSLLYRELARDIPIRVNDFTQSLSFPVVGYGRKRSEFSRKIGIDEKGKIVFLEPRHYWSMPIPIKKGVGSVQDLYFLIDCSGSMKEGGGKAIKNWSSESKYHYALLSFYGVMNYLERMKISSSKIGLTSFSNSSRSLISEYGELREIEKILFTPEFGYTYIDLNQVRMTSEKLGKSVMIMVSDGEIHNWDEIATGMKEIMGKNYSAFISIGEKASPFYELKGYAKVFYVDKVGDLPKIVLDFSKESYGGVV